MRNRKIARADLYAFQPGVVSVHCIYAMYHLSRNAADRAPGSSAAYQIFSAAADLGTISVYAFGSFATHNDSSGWGTQLDDETLLQYLVPAAYYGLVAAGGIHLISFTVSLWLAWAFRKISLMPPDMNPLEDHLTARPMHRRNKSYLTASSDAESVKRSSAWSDVHPAAAHEFIASPRSVPFMHTRAESTESAATTYVQGDLPSRQYQIVPGNKASRRSAASMMPKRDSRPRSGNGPSYTELSTRDLSPEKTQSRDSVDHSHYLRFSEPWDSIEPTNKNSRMVRAAGYSSLDARYNNEDFSDESDVEKELMDARHVYEFDMITDLHPDPLRLNPTPSKTDGAGILKTPPDSWRASDRPTNVTISDAGTNERRTEIIGGTDQPPGDRRRGSSTDTTQPGKPYSHRYGELKPGVVPIPIGSNRKTSSGNDYRVAPVSNAYERRNVSGKIAEEGRVGQRISRYNMLG